MLRDVFELLWLVASDIEWLAMRLLGRFRSLLPTEDLGALGDVVESTTFAAFFARGNGLRIETARGSSTAASAA